MKKHNWISTKIDIHKNEYWYKCTICNKEDWIPFNGEMSFLYPTECLGQKLTKEEVRKIFDLPFISDNKTEKISDILLKGDFNGGKFIND